MQWRGEKREKMRELKSIANGTNGARTFTLTDIVSKKAGKKTRNQLGKLKVQKGAITWYDKCETDNNEFRVSWEEFFAFMRQHPVRKTP